MLERLSQAEAFLQEAVYQSPGRQAAQVGLMRGRMESKPSGPTNCGLGREAAIELALSARAIELSQELWPAGCDGEHQAHIAETMRSGLQIGLINIIRNKEKLKIFPFMNWRF